MTTSQAVELITEAREMLGPFVARLVRQPHVEGVALLSSIAMTGQRVTFDELSDIDLTVWLRAGMEPHEWEPDPRVTRRLFGRSTTDVARELLVPRTAALGHGRSEPPPAGYRV
ncbi:MAG TPA: hypothetical protein VEO01_00255 [Pseudonocardiaceae bacterium]|nr:hypothetical protein [Pseudonocardiaceae bacterium]